MRFSRFEAPKTNSHTHEPPRRMPSENQLRRCGHPFANTKHKLRSHAIVVPLGTAILVSLACVESKGALAGRPGSQLDSSAMRRAAFAF